MNYQVLFYLKNNEKVSINVVCFSLDWRFKGKAGAAWGFHFQAVLVYVIMYVNPSLSESGKTLVWVWPCPLVPAK